MAQQRVDLIAGIPKTVNSVLAFQNTSGYDSIWWEKGLTFSKDKAYMTQHKEKEIGLGSIDITFYSDTNCKITVEV